MSTTAKPPCLGTGGQCSVAVVVVFIAAGGGELPGGEGDPAEHLAGILCRSAGAVAAFLGGQGVVENGDNELSIPFQPDDGELPQSHEEPPMSGGEDQFILKHPADGAGNLDHAALLPIAGIHHPGTEHHGIQHLHHGHQIGRWESYRITVSSYFFEIILIVLPEEISFGLQQSLSLE